MITIYKYAVPLESSFTLELPQMAKILAFQVQKDQPTLWIQVDTVTHTERRSFCIIGTGDPIHNPSSLDYIGSVHIMNGEVWHLFEQRR